LELATGNRNRSGAFQVDRAALVIPPAAKRTLIGSRSERNVTMAVVTPVVPAEPLEITPEAMRALHPEIDESLLTTVVGERYCECLHGANGVGPNDFNRPDDYAVNVGHVDPVPADFNADELAWECGRPAAVMARGKYADCDPDCTEIHMFPICRDCHEEWLAQGSGTPWWPLS